MKKDVIKPVIRNQRKDKKRLDARREKKLKRKATEYYGKSCFNCGLPREFDGRTNINRFGTIPGKDVKCLVCGSLLVQTDTGAPE